MGLLDKFKNMFTEEVEEDEVIEEKIVQPKVHNIEPEEKISRYTEYQKNTPTPIKTTPTRTTPIVDDSIIVKKYEPEPVINIKPEEPKPTMVEEKKVLKREEKFVFPVYFDDKDFEKIEEKKPKPEIKKAPEKKEVYGTKIEKKEEPRVFKPTPIISPIYGVLNENYHQENITSKKVTRTEYRDPSKPITIDDVRKKAYGKLEDDIETTLLAKSSIFMEPEINVEEKEESKNNLLSDLVDDTEYSSVDEFLNSPIEEYEAKHKQSVEDDFDLENTLNSLEDSVNKSIENIESKTQKKSTSSLDNLLSDNYDDDENLLADYIMNNNEENVDNKDDDDLTQSDLFNLIDSMYEKGE